jgi:double zinc ribbon protein
MILLAADSTFNGIHRFFHSQAWYLGRNISLLIVVVFWLGVAFWVNKDARKRIASPWLVGLATLLGLFPPFLGALVYMLFRPPEYLADVRERELEMKAIEERLSLRQTQCPVCRADVEPSFLVCPVCTTRLKHACVNCGAPLEARWQVCPHCETPVESTGLDLPVVEARPRRRRRST